MFAPWKLIVCGRRRDAVWLNRWKCDSEKILNVLYRFIWKTFHSRIFLVACVRRTSFAFLFVRYSRRKQRCPASTWCYTHVVTAWVDCGGHSFTITRGMRVHLFTYVANTSKKKKEGYRDFVNQDLRVMGFSVRNSAAVEPFVPRKLRLSNKNGESTSLVGRAGRIDFRSLRGLIAKLNLLTSCDGVELERRWFARDTCFHSYFVTARQSNGNESFVS